MLALLALLTVPGLAQSPPDVPDDRARVERITEKLGVTEEVASELAAIVTDHREAMSNHRESVKSAVQALRDAREADDTTAMKRQLKELRRLQDRGRDLHDDHHGEIMDLFTVDQQAQWVLFNLHRAVKRRTAGLPHRPR